MSYFEQIIDVERDQGATRDSIREFSELITLYPKSKYTLKAKKNISAFFINNILVMESDFINFNQP